MDGYILAQSCICGLKDRLYGAELGDGYWSGASAVTEERKDESLNYSHDNGKSKEEIDSRELGKYNWWDPGSEQML